MSSVTFWAFWNWKQASQGIIVLSWPS